MTSDPATFSSREFRDAVGRFCTGVTIITGVSADEPVGFCVQSFVSVSLDPSLVAICPAKTSQSWPKIRQRGFFGINILAEDHGHLVEAFAKSGGDKFAGIDWRLSADGLPVLDNATGFIECALEAEHGAGDHTIAVGKVLRFSLSPREMGPLLFFRGRLYTTAAETLAVGEPGQTGHWT